MANNRVSAATKDMIRKVYNNKLKELNNRIEERGKILAEIEVSKLEESNEYQLFKSQIQDFYDYVTRVDEDGDFCDSYSLNRLLESMKEDTFFKTPYRSNFERLYKEDQEISSLIEEKSRVEKELNKLLWDIEMAPKSSNEYKEAVAKAESLLF